MSGALVHEQSQTVSKQEHSVDTAPPRPEQINVWHRRSTDSPPVVTQVEVVAIHLKESNDSSKSKTKNSKTENSKTENSQQQPPQVISAEEKQKQVPLDVVVRSSVQQVQELQVLRQQQQHFVQREHSTEKTPQPLLQQPHGPPARDVWQNMKQASNSVSQEGTTDAAVPRVWQFGAGSVLVDDHQHDNSKDQIVYNSALQRPLVAQPPSAAETNVWLKRANENKQEQQQLQQTWHSTRRDNEDRGKSQESGDGEGSVVSGGVDGSGIKRSGNGNNDVRKTDDRRTRGSDDRRRTDDRRRGEGGRRGDDHGGSYDYTGPRGSGSGYGSRNNAGGGDQPPRRKPRGGRGSSSRVHAPNVWNNEDAAVIIPLMDINVEQPVEHGSEKGDVLPRETTSRQRSNDAGVDGEGRGGGSRSNRQKPRRGGSGSGQLWQEGGEQEPPERRGAQGWRQYRGGTAGGDKGTTRDYQYEVERGGERNEGRGGYNKEGDGGGTGLYGGRHLNRDELLSRNRSRHS